MNIYVDGVLTPPLSAGSLDGVPADLQPVGPAVDGYVVTYIDQDGALELQPASGGVVISTANPQPLGNAAPGTTGEVSDAGHVHELPTATQIDAEVALPLLPVDGALHHWRLFESSSPFADIGSLPSPMDYINGIREYDRAGVYARYGTTMQRSTASDDRCSSTIVIAPGSDITMGITVANEQALVSPPGGPARVIFSLDCAGTRNGIIILTDPNGNIYVNVAVAGIDQNINAISVSWARPFRVDVTRDGATGDTLVYVDGLLKASATIPGTMGAITLAEIGGSARPLVAGSALMMNDATLHTTVLSASTLLSRADVCRRLTVG